MFAESTSTRPAIFKRTGLVSLACCLALMVTACGGTVSSSTATPTTIMGFAAEQGTPPAGQTPEEPTPSSAEPGETATPDMTIIVAGVRYYMQDACALATDAQIEAVLGQPITEVTPGEDADSVSGGTLYYCTYLGSGLAVVISWVDTLTPADAKQALSQQLAKMQADEPSATVSTQSGIGDQAFWTVTSHAAGYVVLNRATVLGVALGGNIGDPAAHQAALKTLTESIASGM